MGLFSWLGKSKESKQINADLLRQQDEERRQRDSLIDKYSDMGNQAYDRSSNLYNESLNNYRDILGKMDDPSGASSTFEELSRTGGYSPEDIAELEGNIGDYKRYASGADISEQDRARMRGAGVYDEFAKTGGFDEGQMQNFRARGTSGTASVFDALKNRLSQQNAAQGGYSPGYESGNRALARDKSREIQAANTNTEGMLQDMIRKNRMAGAEGAERSEGTLQNLLAKKFMEGMGGATNTRFGLNESIAKNRLAGAGGLENTNQSRLAAVNSMAALRGQTPGEVASYNTSLNQAAGQGSAANANILQQRAGYNPNVSGLEKVGNFVSSVAGPVAAAFINPTSAFGSVVKKFKPGKDADET